MRNTSTQIYCLWEDIFCNNVDFAECQFPAQKKHFNCEDVSLSSKLPPKSDRYQSWIILEILSFNLNSVLNQILWSVHNAITARK